MGVWSRRTVIAWLASFVAIVIYVLDRTSDADWSNGSVPVLRAIIIITAVIVAGVCYQTWSTNPPSTPAVICAMVASLAGGAAFASSAASAKHGQILADGILPAVGIAGLVLGSLALTLESISRARSS